MLIIFRNLAVSRIATRERMPNYFFQWVGFVLYASKRSVDARELNTCWNGYQNYSMEDLKSGSEKVRLSEGINYVRSRKRKLVSRVIKRIPMPGFRSCGPRYKKITIPHPFHRMYYPADTPANHERFVSFTGKRIRDTSLGRTYVNIHRTNILYE